MTINLLPDTLRLKLAQRRSRQIALASGAVFLFCLVSFTAGVIAVEARLQGELALQQALNLAAAENLASMENRKLEKEVQSLNASTRTISTFFADRSELSPLIKALTEDISSPLFLTALSYEAETGTLLIEGFSPTREALLATREKLRERTDLFAAVDFPPSNWVRAESILFEATLTVSN